MARSFSGKGLFMVLMEELVRRIETAKGEKRLNGFAPTAEVDLTKETVVGTLPSHLWPDYIVLCEAINRLDALDAEILRRIDEAGGDPDDIPERDQRGIVLNHKALENWYRLVSHVFWAEVRNAIPRIPQGTLLGMRAGWQIVKRHEKPVPRPSAIFAGAGAIPVA